MFVWPPSGFCSAAFGCLTRGLSAEVSCTAAHCHFSTRRCWESPSWAATVMSHQPHVESTEVSESLGDPGLAAHCESSPYVLFPQKCECGYARYCEFIHNQSGPIILNIKTNKQKNNISRKYLSSVNAIKNHSKECSSPWCELLMRTARPWCCADLHICDMK